MDFLSYDPEANLAQWPMSFAKFGLNPYGKPMYRCVFAPSRRHLCKGPGPDGSPKVAWLHKYPAEASRKSWVLEKWMSLEAYGVTAEGLTQWNDLSPNPLNAQGEYEACHEFFELTPTNANFDKLIQWIEMGHKRRPIENAIAIRAQAETEAKTEKQNRIDFLLEKMPAFGSAPVSGYGGGSGTKTKGLRLNVSQLPMPQMPMQAVFGGKNKPLVELGR